MMTILSRTVVIVKPNHWFNGGLNARVCANSLTRVEGDNAECSAPRGSALLRHKDMAINGLSKSKSDSFVKLRYPKHGVVFLWVPLPPALTQHVGFIKKN